MSFIACRELQICIYTIFVTKSTDVLKMQSQDFESAWSLYPSLTELISLISSFYCLLIAFQVFCKSVDARTPEKSRAVQDLLKKEQKTRLETPIFVKLESLGLGRSLYFRRRHTYNKCVYNLTKYIFCGYCRHHNICTLLECNVSTDVVINFLSLSTMLLWHQIWLPLLLIPSLFLCFLTFPNSSSCMALHL